MPGSMWYFCYFHTRHPCSGQGQWVQIQGDRGGGDLQVFLQVLVADSVHQVVDDDGARLEGQLNGIVCMQP